MIMLPERFRERMESLLQEEYPAFLASYERPRKLALRVNTLKADPEDIRRRLPYLEDEVPWEKSAFYYDALDAEGKENRPGKSPLHEAGCFYIQEPSAMAVAALSGAAPGERVLDLCAAPGGKSTQLAAMMEGRGLLVSNEINQQRAKILSRNIERCGIVHAVVTNEDSAALAFAFPSFFDRVIVDAPCSGEGMFKKEQAALDMWSEDNIRLCHERQMEILGNAAELVRYGGTLVYSTCTFAPEEDEETVAAFLASYPEFHLKDLPKLLGEKMDAWGFETGRPSWCTEAVPEEIKKALSCAIRLFPHKLEGEGHFLAVLTKGEETPQVMRGGLLREGGDSFDSASLQGSARRGRRQDEEKKRKGSRKKSGEGSRGTIAGEEQYLAFVGTALKDKSRKKYLSVPKGGKVLSFGQELYLMPDGTESQGIRILRPGLDLGSIKKDRFEPAHALALSLKPEDAAEVFEIDADSERAAAWLRGESIPCDPALRGWVLVTFDGYSAGWGKAAGGMLKNHYPKGLRRPY